MYEEEQESATLQNNRMIIEKSEANDISDEFQTFSDYIIENKDNEKKCNVIVVEPQENRPAKVSIDQMITRTKSQNQIVLMPKPTRKVRKSRSRVRTPTKTGKSRNLRKNSNKRSQQIEPKSETEIKRKLVSRRSITYEAESKRFEHFEDIQYEELVSNQRTSDSFLADSNSSHVSNGITFFGFIAVLALFVPYLIYKYFEIFKSYH